jgi:hypothetical protein
MKDGKVTYEEFAEYMRRRFPDIDPATLTTEQRRIFEGTTSFALYRLGLAVNELGRSLWDALPAVVRRWCGEPK